MPEVIEGMQEDTREEVDTAKRMRLYERVSYGSMSTPPLTIRPPFLRTIL